MGARRRWLVGTALVAGMVFAGCSDNDEPGATPTAGGTAPSSGTAAAPGTDESYVRELCTAMDQFFKNVQEGTSGITPDDPSGIANAFTDAFAPALEQFAEDMDAATPPDDAREWHDDAVDRLNRVADDIRAGKGLEALAQLGDNPLPDPPARIESRLADAARKVPECQQYEDAFSRG